MRYSKHLTALYKNEYWLPFPLLSDLYETHLTLDENSLQTMMRDIRAALSPVIIAQPDAFDATLCPEFNVLFTVIPSCSLSILILTLCRPEGGGVRALLLLFAVGTEGSGVGLGDAAEGRIRNDAGDGSSDHSSH